MSRQVYLCLLVASLVRSGAYPSTVGDVYREENATSVIQESSLSSSSSSSSSSLPIRTTAAAASPGTKQTTENTTLVNTASQTVTNKRNRSDNSSETDDMFKTSPEEQLPDNTNKTSILSIINSGSISKYVYNDFKDVSVSIQLILIILGILTNMCNIIVFANKRMRSSTSTILTFLSCSELGVTITELILSSSTASAGKHTYATKLFWTLFRWLRLYLTTVFQRCSFCFNIFVATERFIAVRFPLKAHHILRRDKPVTICVVIVIITIGIHIYNPLKIEVVPVHSECGIMYKLQDSQLYAKNPEVFDVFFFVTKIMFAYIPLFSCLLMNIMMVVALWNQKKQRRRMQANQGGQQQNNQREMQTTVTVLVSTFLFVILSLPVTVTSIVENINPDFGHLKKEHYLFRFITLFGGLLYLLSLSMDFFVYMILTRAFRQTFISLCRFFCRKFRHHNTIIIGDVQLRTSSGSVSNRDEQSVPTIGYLEAGTATQQTADASVETGFGVNSSTNTEDAPVEAMKTEDIVMQNATAMVKYGVDKCVE